MCREASVRPRETLSASFVEAGWPPGEAAGLARLALTLVGLPEPRDLVSLFPDLIRLRDRLGESLAGTAPEEVEERLLELYVHLHMNDGLYAPEERARMDAAGGYWNHAGGLSPLLKAGRWIETHTASADFGAGNGLQGLLLQILHPHSRTDLIEISSRMAEVGEMLREWLGVTAERVRWLVADVCDVSAAGYGFIYLYRPVRPEGSGRRFYERLAREVEGESHPPVIFSVADCLRGFLSQRYEVFYSDGHLTCFRHA